MLAASLLEKRSIEAPNLKSLRLFHLFEYERTSTKMHNPKSRFVIGPSNMLFAGVYVCTFHPENLQSGAVKGLIITYNYEDSSGAV